jgi:hypothetical protein
VKGAMACKRCAVVVAWQQERLLNGCNLCFQTIRLCNENYEKAQEQKIPALLLWKPVN